jgi:hypothetical protein
MGPATKALHPALTMNRRSRVFAGTEIPDVYVEAFVVDSWAERERPHDRFTRANHGAERRVLSSAMKPIEVKHYIHAAKNCGSWLSLRLQKPTCGSPSLGMENESKTTSSGAATGESWLSTPGTA